MTIALILALLIATVAIAVAIVAYRCYAALLAERDASGFRALLDHQVDVSVTDGGVIRGVLVGVYADALVLRHPVYAAGSRPAGIGDEATIARSSAPVVTRTFDRGED